MEDLTDEWGVILEQRFAMYRELREETLRQGLPAGDEEFYAAYGKLVELVKRACSAVGASLPRNQYADQRCSISTAASLKSLKAECPRASCSIARPARWALHG